MILSEHLLLNASTLLSISLLQSDKTNVRRTQKNCCQSCKINKRDLFKKLKKDGINLMVHYIPVHTQPYYKKKYNYNNNELKNSIEFYKKVFSLPIYKDLNNQNIEYISEKILKYVK